MVNILKRMRKLDERLLRIRNGAGAATLPPPSSKIPYITRIHLTHPHGPGTFTPTYHGSRIFWRTHLPRLKYYNPALPITVTHERASGNVLTGHVEGDKNIGQLKQDRPTQKPSDGQQTPSETSSSSSSTQAEAAEASLTVFFDDTITSFTPDQKYEDFQQQPQLSSSSSPSTTTSSPTSTTPSSTPESTKTATSTRTATLSTQNLSASKIYAWLVEQTGLIPVPTSEADQKRWDELNAFRSKANNDRDRVKKGMDEKRAHEAMLRRARGDAEKMKREN